MFHARTLRHLLLADGVVLLDSSGHGLKLSLDRVTARVQISLKDHHPQVGKGGVPSEGWGLDSASSGGGGQEGGLWTVPLRS